MDLANASSNSTPQTVRERMREKILGTLKAARLQTSLAAKIKSKNLNNSSVLKISLKHNNRALACALTAEKENARRLESDKMILQKEVKMLHFQNARLRHDLSIVNRMLKDIDVFMNINLPAAIEICNQSESSDLLTTEERKSKCFSRESRLSVEELQGFRLTGMALRVPSSSTEQQKCNDIPAALLNEDENLRSTDSFTAKEMSDEQHEIQMNASLLTAKERCSSNNKNVTYDSSLNMKENSVLPLDEDLISSSRNGGGFVTRRRKRSTASRSSTQSVNSDINHSKNSLGIGRESCCSTQWGTNKHDNLPPEPEHLAVSGENALHLDYMRKDMMLEMSCSPLSLNQNKNINAKKENQDTPLDMETTHQPDLVLSGECDRHLILDRPVEQEKTVYEADMEMTSSDSAAIVAVIPKRKMKTSKSSIPVKQDGASLRKVKTTAHEKTKRSSPCKGKDNNMSSKGKEKLDITLNIDNDVPLEFKPGDPKPDLFNRHDSRRTFVLPGPANEDKAKVCVSEPKLYPGKNETKTSVVCSVEESFTENIDENIPMDFKANSADKYDSWCTFVLPGPVNKEKTTVFESEAKPYPDKNKANPSVVCSVEESFIETIDDRIPREFKPPADFRQDSTHQYNSRRTYVLPGPVKKDKTQVFENKTKLYPDKKESKPSVSCDVEKSFTDANSDLVFAVGNFPHSDVEQSTNKPAVKKRKSKSDKKPAKDTENSKKKRKIATNLRAVENINEAQDGHISDELDKAKIINTLPSSSMNNRAPHIRRETYVLSSTKPNYVLSEPIPKDNAIHCRRETFVIPEPNCLNSASEENAERLPLKPTVSKDIQLVNEDVVGMENTDSNIVSHGLNTEFTKPLGFRKSICKQVTQNKKSSDLFSQVDKRKTRILATNHNDLSNDKDTLVRESCVNAAQSHFSKSKKFLNAVMANEQDSFMLDMVSESILDGSLDCPSFVEFPSTTNLGSHDNASMYNVSLNSIPLLDPPVSDEQETKEDEQLNTSLDENDNGPAQELLEDESNQCCKVENQSMEINEADIKPFQDLTNKTHDVTKLSPKSSSEDQEEAQSHSRRRRNPVNYKEPSLGKKLRRGDSGADLQNLSVSKGKGKKAGGRKKKTKSEECPTESV